MSGWIFSDPRGRFESRPCAPASQATWSARHASASSMTHMSHTAQPRGVWERGSFGTFFRSHTGGNQHIPPPFSIFSPSAPIEGEVQERARIPPIPPYSPGSSSGPSPGTGGGMRGTARRCGSDPELRRRPQPGRRRGGARRRYGPGPGIPMIVRRPRQPTHRTPPRSTCNDSCRPDSRGVRAAERRRASGRSAALYEMPPSAKQDCQPSARGVVGLKPVGEDCQSAPANTPSSISSDKSPFGSGGKTK